MALTTERPVITGFAALERHVRDVDRSVDFYVQGLGFQLLRDANAEYPDAHALLGLGEDLVALHAIREGEGGTAIVAAHDVRFQHVAIVTTDIDVALGRLAHLQAHASAPITTGGPQLLPVGAGGVTAYKFRDPDGHPLELIQFPANDMPIRWRRRGTDGSAVTRGIDHSAIGVHSVEFSRTFYEQLGFEVTAHHVNSGPAQAKLDGLAEHDVAVEVVAMKLPHSSGPHVELLGYRQPAALRSLPRRVAGDAGGPVMDRLVWHGSPGGSEISDPDDHRHRVMARPRARG